MSTVYVLNKDGKPLMPTTRCGHVRHLLKEQKARVVTSKPFTIQLLYETDDVVQPLYLGIDPGRTNIGVAVVKTDEMAASASVQKKLASLNAIFPVARKMYFVLASKTKKQSSIIGRDQPDGSHLPQISCCRHTLTW